MTKDIKISKNSDKICIFSGKIERYKSMEYFPVFKSKCGNSFAMPQISLRTINDKSLNKELLSHCEKWIKKSMKECNKCGGQIKFEDK